MPHITLDSKIDLGRLSDNFEPILAKSPLIRISNIYVDRKKTSALLPAVAIDARHQEYFIQVSTTDSKTTLRLCAQTGTVKTDSVKLSLVLLYRQVLGIFPSVKILHSNLLGMIGADAGP